MYGHPIAHNIPPSDRIGDIAFGELVHGTQPTRVTIHYAGRPFAVVNFIASPKKKGILAKIKKIFAKRKVLIRYPY